MKSKKLKKNIGFIRPQTSGSFLDLILSHRQHSVRNFLLGWNDSLLSTCISSVASAPIIGVCIISFFLSFKEILPVNLSGFGVPGFVLKMTESM